MKNFNLNMDNENKILKLKDGRNLGYAEYGDSVGKPLFFFHGWPGSRFRSKGLNGIAKKMHIRIISVDRPGFGLSDYKKGRKLLDWPDDICELADSLNIKKFSIVGISGGGPYVAACTYKIPHRLITSGIVVGLGPTHFKGAFDGISLSGKIGWENYARFPITTIFSSISWVIISRYLPFLINSPFTFKAKPDRELLTAEYVKEMRQTFLEAFRQGHKGPTLDLRIYSTDWGFKLEDIKTKVYLWYGDADKNVSLNMGKYYRDHIKGSVLKVYPNEGHFLIRNHTEEILKTLLS